MVPLSDGQWLQSTGACTEEPDGNIPCTMQETQEFCLSHLKSNFSFRSDPEDPTQVSKWNWLSSSKIYAPAFLLVQNMLTLETITCFIASQLH